jgi:hypothetical protein
MKQGAPQNVVDSQISDQAHTNGQTSNHAKPSLSNPMIESQPRPAATIDLFNRMPAAGKDLDLKKLGEIRPSRTNEIFAGLRGKSGDLVEGQKVLAEAQTAKALIIPLRPNSDIAPIGTPGSSDKVGGGGAAGNTIGVNYEIESATDEKIIVQVKTGNLETGAQAADQSGSDAPTIGSEGDIQTVGLSFADNLIAAASKKAANPESLTRASELNRAVFEQIEPRILGLIGSTQTGVDKRVLKMRLNPAELGAVEITLEKNSSGSISAHFQTENEKTRQILSESLMQLRASLENSGWHVGNLNISCGASSNGEGGTESQSQNFGKAEDRSALTTGSGGDSSNEGEKEDRLVNLRA